MFNVRLILTLLNIDRLGRKTINKILKYELPTNLDESAILNYLNECRAFIKRMPKVDLEHIVKAKVKCEEILKECEAKNIKIISILDKDFPERLKIIDDNPVLVYYKGNLECISDNRAVAIIGTRVPTIQGEKIAYNYSKILSQNNFVIVSGLALGCDTFAHIGTLHMNGKTVAVMPCGLDIIYPKSNKKLYESIINNDGCVISEYAPNVEPYKNQFIERDRLQSALSIGVVVIETSVNGGTMHTANFAIKQNKLVACYIPKENLKYKSSLEGNFDLLKNKIVYPIYDIKSLNNFILKIEEKMKFINENLQVKEYYQMKFTL
ncbi:DNA-processing protein DprA [Terrisporobacter sp.]